MLTMKAIGTFRAAKKCSTLHIKSIDKSRDLPCAVLVRFTKYWMMLCVGLFQAVNRCCGVQLEPLRWGKRPVTMRNATAMNSCAGYYAVLHTQEVTGSSPAVSAKKVQGSQRSLDFFIFIKNKFVSNVLVTVECAKSGSPAYIRRHRFAHIPSRRAGWVS